MIVSWLTEAKRQVGIVDKAGGVIRSDAKLFGEYVDVHRWP